MTHNEVITLIEIKELNESLRENLTNQNTTNTNEIEDSKKQTKQKYNKEKRHKIQAYIM